MNVKKTIPWIVSTIILLILAWYYFIHSGRPINKTFVNATIAFASTIILSIAIILGPLSEIKFLKKILQFRRTFGLIGFGLATTHVLISIPIMLESERTMLFSDLGSMAFAAIAFVIFLIMAVTSTYSWQQKMGYDNWKNLQRTGYLAFIFTLAHIFIIRQGFFLNTEIGKIVLLIGIITLLARTITFLIHLLKNKTNIKTDNKTKKLVKK
jgi:DMSO/TMAO reductase YedYZ heme-binding membrane subunit